MNYKNYTYQKNFAKRILLTLGFFLLLGIFTACEKSISTPVTGIWKYQFGDNKAWAAPNYDDSSWKGSELPKRIPIPEGSGYLWLRKTLTVPSVLNGKTIYLNFGKNVSTMEIYLNGELFETYGDMQNSKTIHGNYYVTRIIPPSYIRNGTISIACRLWTPRSYLSFEEVVFGNAAYADLINRIKNLFNRELFLIFAVLSLFLAVYHLFTFLNNTQDETHLWYMLTLFCSVIYYFQVGSSYHLVSYNWAQSIGRASLASSLAFFYLFARSYTIGKIGKIEYIIVFSIIAIFYIVFLAFRNNSFAMNTIFNISLGFIFTVMTIAIIIYVKTLLRKQDGILTMIIFFLIGMCFASHDIFMQVTGKSMFVSLQSFAFFFNNMGIFIALAKRSANMSISLERQIDTITNQANRLSVLLENIRLLSTDSENMSHTLEQAVEEVTATSQQTASRANNISYVISNQKRTLVDATNVVSNLVQSLKKANKNIEEEAESITRTADRTAELIEGFSAVGQGVKGAAGFAETLDKFAGMGVQNMKNLSNTMEKVQESSHEILSVVKILDDFAARTNLLAMNASIEAAHAGVAGKGFAIVANEIKSLAAASSAQASKINDIIQEINMLIEESVTLSDSVNNSFVKIEQEASSTARYVQKAADEMAVQQKNSNDIIQEVNMLSNAANDMKKSILEQASYSEQVIGAMTELRGASDSVSSASMEIVRGTESLSDQISELSALADRAEETATHLVAIINASDSTCKVK